MAFLDSVYIYLAKLGKIIKTTMQNYLIIGGSSGIGQELANQLSQTGNHIIATYNKNEPKNEKPDIDFHPLNVLEETFSLDFTR